VQKNLLKFSAHVPVSDEQDKILGAVYLPCDQLRAKKSLHAAATNCHLDTSWTLFVFQGVPI
jgi:hypothetical protein